MERIVIDNHSTLSDVDALECVKKVIKKGANIRNEYPNVDFKVAKVRSIKGNNVTTFFVSGI